jgi:hypothetical protein
VHAASAFVAHITGLTFAPPQESRKELVDDVEALKAKISGNKD